MSDDLSAQCGFGDLGSRPLSRIEYEQRGRICELEVEVARLQMEVDASCNAEELRQARAEAENSEREFVEFRDEMDRRLGLEVRKFEDAQARYEQAEEQLAIARAEVARLREDVLRWFAYIDPFELVDDDRKHFERWREKQALAAVGGEEEESK